MTVAITGSDGRLAGAVAAACERAGLSVRRLTRADLDITRDQDVASVVSALAPDVIVNCASYNAVDEAEQRPIHALEVNAFGVRALARAAAGRGALLIHYSTDFVFDGTGAVPYAETDTPNPQSVYAASKLLGEWFALEAPGSYVLRVESLFDAAPAAASPRSNSSLEKIVAGIDAGDEVQVFTDRTVSPSSVIDVAGATRALIRHRPEAGLYHCVNTGFATWEQIAIEAARQMGRTPTLRPVTVESVALPAPRPRYCALSNAKLAAAGIVMPAWQDALARLIAGRAGRSVGRRDSPDA